MLEKNQTHRESVKNKPSAKIEEHKINFIHNMKSIKDYGEVQFQVTTDYKDLINRATCEAEKAELIGRLLQLTLILHDNAVSNDVY